MSRFRLQRRSAQGLEPADARGYEWKFFPGVAQAGLCDGRVARSAVMNRLNFLGMRPAALAATLWLALSAVAAAADYEVKAGHPRLLIEDVAVVARNAAGPLADDYRVVKERADAAVPIEGFECVH